MEAADAEIVPSVLSRFWEICGIWTWIGVGIFFLLLFDAGILLLRGSTLEGRLAFWVSCPIPLLCGVADFGWRCFAISYFVASCGVFNHARVLMGCLEALSSIAIGAGLTIILVCLACAISWRSCAVGHGGPQVSPYRT
jgi:hypothetical protein